ncbi:tRNA (adenine-N(1)-)-methyltransferase catalytic subunit TRMT61A [Salpingoeca rosetta]|uniref:tRNA (adenine(58)-N(1))-methyltransferase n=1 Tax=Salpingoeca rosetta (strain ATCC 50818 / BSB-021) TaxID=946362 RepID=F2U806_SALR5|nr:tRNA (adenine-N(1)-)-methyltransferase catalytic subunit TRMT61A [Salpingoeca rosetta]EGD72911.1 tRNA (adenine-N(1)-)-methyltransferase catalytic subunit TRMT61A [Salpingoeca rosetta]|eukprot:XP_004994733.1 tRNA (adenine-N(1)-)-methyltransferase catalytic subunit TRMT61A [Salpingoeca rosetta]
MSFVKFKDVIEDGDTVIVKYAQHSSFVVVEKGKDFHNKHGRFLFDDMIGKPFGSRIYASDRGSLRSYIYAMHPTPEYWTEVLPHRTQIIYASDISMVTFMLDLKPGSVVLETGTGSGSLSHAIARTIAPTGHLHTFDFHAERVEKAKAEFASHGLSDVITVKQADATRDGFGVDGLCDAVFLDLPSPHLALPFADKALKSTGGRLCSFSPCIEQVQRTCDLLRDMKYTDILTIEVLERKLEAKPTTMPECPLTSTAPPKAGKRKAGESSGASKRDKRGSSIDDTSALSFTSTNHVAEQKGHTGFLTFATKPHALLLQSPAEDDDEGDEGDEGRKNE